MTLRKFAFTSPIWVTMTAILNAKWETTALRVKHTKIPISTNCGNFRALLNYTVNGGDEALEAHCERAKECHIEVKNNTKWINQHYRWHYLKRIVADIRQGWCMVQMKSVIRHKEQDGTLRFCDANGKSRRKHGSGQWKVDILMSNFLFFHGKHNKFIGEWRLL